MQVHVHAAGGREERRVQLRVGAAGARHGAPPRRGLRGGRGHRADVLICFGTLTHESLFIIMVQKKASSDEGILNQFK